MPGQPVKIEAPEDPTKKYEVVPEHLRAASVEDLKRCTVWQEHEPVCKYCMAILAPTEITHFWHFNVKADAELGDKILIPMDFDTSFRIFNFLVVEPSVDDPVLI